MWEFIIYYLNKENIFKLSLPVMKNAWSILSKSYLSFLIEYFNHSEKIKCYTDEVHILHPWPCTSHSSLWFSLPPKTMLGASPYLKARTSALSLTLVHLLSPVLPSICLTGAEENKIMESVPWPSSSVGWGVILIAQGCDSRSGHMQELADECTDGWNNELMFLFLSLPLSLSLWGQ